MLPVFDAVRTDLNVCGETGMFKCLSVTEGNAALGPEVQFGVTLHYDTRGNAGAAAPGPAVPSHHKAESTFTEDPSLWYTQ